jgi:hypothetical protein
VKAIITGLMALFNAGGAFYNDVAGRLFFGSAPDGTNLSDGPYAIFFPVSDTDNDTFTDAMRDVYIQFSLFSGASSPAEIMDMDTHLSTMFKDVEFLATGYTMVIMERVQSNGPNSNPADVESGTGFYWQMDVDYQIKVSQT